MKKIILISTLLFISACFFTSCKKEGSISIETNLSETIATPGSTLMFSVKLSPDETEKSELGRVTISDGESTFFTKDFTGKESQSFVFEYIVDESSIIGDVIFLKILATDSKSGFESTKTLTINVVETSSIDIQIDPQLVNAVPGDDIEYSITLTPDVQNGGELNNFQILKDGIELTSEVLSGINSQQINFTYSVPTTYSNGDLITLEFVADDAISGNICKTYAFIQVVNESFVDIQCDPETAYAGIDEDTYFTITLTPDISNGGELGNFKIFSGSGELLDSKSFSGYLTQTTNYTFTVPSSATIGDEFTLVLEATDNNSNRVTTKEILVVVTDAM